MASVVTFFTRNRSGSAGSLILSGAALAAALAYAILRYHVAAGVAWAQLPLYVSNKGISLASVVLIAAAYLVNRRMPADPAGRDVRRRLAKGFGLAGFVLLLLHSVISTVIFDVARYPRLFTEDRLNTAGWVCIVSGGIGVVLFAVPAACSTRHWRQRLSTLSWKRAQHVGYVGLALMALHAMSVGLGNWPAVERWPGGLPPISLISFLVCLAPLGAKFASRYATRAPHAIEDRPPPSRAVLVPSRSEAAPLAHRLEADDARHSGARSCL